ncbi:MAG: amidohydrolase family protein [Opitutaceae bacterium]
MKASRLLLLVLLALTVSARAAENLPDDPSVKFTDPVVALTNARIIDGLGNPAREGQTIVLRDGRITAMGKSPKIPSDAVMHDLDGKTVMPGLVMVHKHSFYSSMVDGPFHMNQMEYSFPRMYLAAGVTTARTTGSLEPYTDLELRDRIERGEDIGPDYHLTAPYVDGIGTGIPQLHGVKSPADAARMINYWAEEGFTSIKLYVSLPAAEMDTAIKTAHANGLQVTGHIGRVSYREAAAMGIDNLEHGFLAASDWVAGRMPDEPANIGKIYDSIAEVNPKSKEVTQVIQHLIDENVAITSTLAIFETFTRGRPPAGEAELAALAPPLRESYLKTWAAISQSENDTRLRSWENNLVMEVDFFNRGGLLVVGTDPTGYGGCLAGYGSWRAIELLVEAGLSPIDAIKCATSNGAQLLSIAEQTGSIEVGKAADLIIVNGNPDEIIADLRKTETVFKDGIGYDSATLFKSIAGMAGIQ